MERSGAQADHAVTLFNRNADHVEAVRRNGLILTEAARNMLVEQDHPVLGRVTLPNLPFRFSGCDTTPRRAAPLLGQHNGEIAAELGYSSAEITALWEAGVFHAEEAAR